MKKRYFEDLREGEQLICEPVAMTREAIIDFGKRFDPQPFHIDDSAAKASLFGGLVASSLHTLSACTRAVVEAQGNVAMLSQSGALGLAIIDYANDHDIDCIVIGSHKPGLRDFLLGSTAARVTRHAPCAVHVLRTTP